MKSRGKPRNLKSRGLSSLIFTFFLLLMAGCQNASTQVDLNVSAAASLQESLEEMANLFMNENPDVNIHLNFAGSSVLQQQIIEGFEVDLFLSAHVDIYQELVDLGFVEDGAQFARNQVVLISSSEAVQSFEDISNDGVAMVMGNEEVPIGIVSRAVLEKADQANPGFKAEVMANLITEANNVRQVFTIVNLGEGDAAFVYATDVQANESNEVSIIEIPEAFQVFNDLYMALLKQDEVKDEAREFFEFILSEAGQDVLARHGFQSKN